MLYGLSRRDIFVVTACHSHSHAMLSFTIIPATCGQCEFLKTPLSAATAQLSGISDFYVFKILISTTYCYQITLRYTRVRGMTIYLADITDFLPVRTPEYPSVSCRALALCSLTILSSVRFVHASTIDCLI